MRKYYPTYWSGCEPIHEVCNWLYVRRIIRSARQGKKIPPIIIDGGLRNGNLITGTHRAAANDLMMMLAERNGSDPALIDCVYVDELPTYVQRIIRDSHKSSYTLDELLPKKWGGV